MPNILFDPTIEGLARTLTLHQRRHEVLTSNLANVETPGYRARELDFQDALREAFARLEAMVSSRSRSALSALPEMASVPVRSISVSRRLPGAGARRGARGCVPGQGSWCRWR